MTLVGLPEVTVGSDLVTMACRAGQENGLLVAEEFHLLDLPEARGCLSTVLRPRRPVAACRGVRVMAACRTIPQM